MRSANLNSHPHTSMDSGKGLQKAETDNEEQETEEKQETGHTETNLHKTGGVHNHRGSSVSNNETTLNIETTLDLHGQARERQVQRMRDHEKEPLDAKTGFFHAVSPDSRPLMKKWSTMLGLDERHAASVRARPPQEDSHISTQIRATFAHTHGPVWPGGETRETARGHMDPWEVRGGDGENGAQARGRAHGQPQTSQRQRRSTWSAGELGKRAESRPHPRDFPARTWGRSTGVLTSTAQRSRTPPPL